LAAREKAKEKKKMVRYLPKLSVNYETECMLGTLRHQSTRHCRIVYDILV